ncbi:WapI family immunity protein [Micromonospora sp. CPCC 206061]|uniref:WapI family immunity protein n=1 Tax=Micromonospora sp. CPCC 206061 TaxID=3122410 RepID=UPI003FA56215
MAFTDPCLLIEEARELAIWLRNAAQDRIASGRTVPGEQVEPSLSFMEPVLGFPVAAHRDDELVLHVEFTAEATPPWLRVENPHSAQYTVELRLRSDELLAAATAWSQELDALPSRTFASTD